jgi:cGMP-specific 3',5'-cyclic phosphodiesterase, invertebrate
MKVVEHAILSTDLAMYFKKRTNFLELVDNGEFDWQCEEKKEGMSAHWKMSIFLQLYFSAVLCGMMMTACDVSAISKPWEVQHKVAKLVADEFFDQGDLEKLQLNQQPMVRVTKKLDKICHFNVEFQAMMDRERKDELPQMQVGFIDVICKPLYKASQNLFQNKGYETN